MRDCLEYIGNIIAVHLFAPGELAFSFPFNVRKSNILYSDIQINGDILSLESLRDANGYAVDTYYNTTSDNKVIIEDATIKESQKLTTAGICFHTKIDIRSMDHVDVIRDSVVYYSGLDYFDVIIVDSSYRIFLVRGIEPSTSISVSAKLPVSGLQGISIEISSVNGIQPVYDML